MDAAPSGLLRERSDERVIQEWSDEFDRLLVSGGLRLGTEVDRLPEDAGVSGL